jgi:hypothetical protein
MQGTQSHWPQWVGRYVGGQNKMATKPRVWLCTCYADKIFAQPLTESTAFIMAEIYVNLGASMGWLLGL